MDLGAYAMIDVIEKVAKENEICVPRLRGYRLMVCESSIDYRDCIKDLEIQCVENLVRAIPFWSPNANAYEYSSLTDKRLKKYLTKDPWSSDEEDEASAPVRVRWENIHGKKKKILKTMVHNWARRYKKQYDTWNKYVGREDILYIHARIGGWNWPTYASEVVNTPWYIEHVDDAFDRSYCDIYAKIDPMTIKSLEIPEPN